MNWMSRKGIVMRGCRLTLHCFKGSHCKKVVSHYTVVSVADYCVSRQMCKMTFFVKMYNCMHMLMLSSPLHKPHALLCYLLASNASYNVNLLAIVRLFSPAVSSFPS